MKKTDSLKQRGKPMDFKIAMQKSAALCSRQEQCSSHIREKLKLWKVKEEDMEKIIKRLTEEKFLDDRRYAGFYAKDKFRFNGWGRIKIAQMLRIKEIDEEFIAESLGHIDNEEYQEACTTLIRSKAGKLADPRGYARKGKLYRFASGRGFEADIIYRALRACGEH